MLTIYDVSFDCTSERFGRIVLKKLEKMKRILFVLLICIFLKHVSLQEQNQQQEIQNLQEQVRFLFKYLGLAFTKEESKMVGLKQVLL